MVNPQTLLPEVMKLLPGVSAQEIMQGIQQFAKAHPNLNNQQALQALMMYLQSQKQGPQAPVAPQQPPFQGLMNKLGAR